MVERGWATTKIIAHASMISDELPNKRLLPNGEIDERIESIVPWLIMQELEIQGIVHWKNDPDLSGANTDEGWKNPSKICSRILLDEEYSDMMYVSAIFYSEPKLSVLRIVTDSTEPKNCQK